MRSPANFLTHSWETSDFFCYEKRRLINSRVKFSSLSRFFLILFLSHSPSFFYIQQAISIQLMLNGSIWLACCLCLFHIKYQTSIFFHFHHSTSAVDSSKKSFLLLFWRKIYEYDTKHIFNWMHIDDARQVDTILYIYMETRTRWRSFLFGVACACCCCKLQFVHFSTHKTWPLFWSADRFVCSIKFNCNRTCAIGRHEILKLVLVFFYFDRTSMLHMN